MGADQRKRHERAAYPLGGQEGGHNYRWRMVRALGAGRRAAAAAQTDQP